MTIQALGGDLAHIGNIVVISQGLSSDRLCGLPSACSALGARDRVRMAVGCAAHTIELTDHGQHVWRMSHAA